MAQIITRESRVTRDPQNDAIRTWFDLSLEPTAKAPFIPRDLAYQVLRENAELFRWKAELSDLRDLRVNDGPNAHSVRFIQEFKGVPVDASEVVVNIHTDGSVQSVYNNYHYNIPQKLDPKKIKVNAGQARELVERLLRVYENHEAREPELIIYRYQRINNHPPKPPRGPNGHRNNFLAAADAHLSENLPNDNSPQEGPYFLAWDITWTPTEVGHECVLAIVECANDRAVTQELPATAHVEHSNLVPFDNNIAQRNLAPTAAKGKMVRGFYVRNPDAEVRTIALHFDADLPRGWRFRTNLVNPVGLRLGPLERRWVETVIDQAEGAEVTRFDRPYTLTVTGTIEDRVIGGMTFYVAPESAFGKPHKPEVEICRPEDLFCLNIPWRECEVEGEIEMKLRFRKK